MDEITLDELISDYKNLSTSDHAHAIGHLCMQWSRLESISDIFLSILLGMDETEIRAAVINNAGQRDKWHMLDAVGFIKRPSDGWYRRLKDNLVRIDDELRTERNRMVHDRWAPIDGEIIRTQPIGRVIREQARQLAFKATNEKPVTEAEVWELVVVVSAVSGYLMELINEYINPPVAQPPSLDTGG